MGEFFASGGGGGCAYEVYHVLLNTAKWLVTGTEEQYLTSGVSGVRQRCEGRQVPCAPRPPCEAQCLSPHSAQPRSVSAGLLVEDRPQGGLVAPLLATRSRVTSSLIQRIIFCPFFLNPISETDHGNEKKNRIKANFKESFTFSLLVHSPCFLPDSKSS